MSSIPSLDLSHFTGNNNYLRDDFIKSIGNAFETFGFVSVKNHFLQDISSQELFSELENFFSEPDGLKRKYERLDLNGQRGYVGKQKEHAKGSTKGDLKEFFHVGQANSQELPNNIAVEEHPELLPRAIRVYQQLEKTGVIILRAIAAYLGLPNNYFDQKVNGADSVLRLIHYFPIENLSTDGAVRAGEHGDINLITLLMGASADGLEIKNRKGEWIPVTAIDGHIVVNVGDMLERLTNNKLRSSIHRVVNPSDSNQSESRYSIPFFMHPRKNVSLACLPQCISDQNPRSYEDITAGEFLNQRLMEIGLLK